MTDAANDPVVRGLRGEISDVDGAILAAVNRRLELVDRAREDEILARLHEVNRGPLTAAGLEELVSDLLALTKRELLRR